MSNLKKLVEKIETLQEEFEEGEIEFVIGEQLKDIAERSNSQTIEILLQDLEIKEMGLSAVEKKIKAYADYNRGNKSSFAVSCSIAENIICDFYRIPNPPKEVPKHDEFKIDIGSYI